ncbi:hypothetical protein D3C73_1268980 [compost metagenome]
MHTVAVNPVMQNGISIIADRRLILIKSCRNRPEIDDSYNGTQHKQHKRPWIVYARPVSFVK